MGQIRRPRSTPLERARRFAELHRELAALYAEEAEVLEEQQGEEEEEEQEVVEETEEEDPRSPEL
jgi:hypothetical protein